MIDVRTVPLLCGLALGAHMASGCSESNAPGEVVTPYALQYYHALDLETGVVTDCSPDPPPCASGDDLHLAYNATASPPAVVIQNQQGGRQVAHLRGRAFASVRLADTAGAGFSSAPIGEPFDATRTVLIRTEAGNIYKLGNPVEFGPSATDSVRFDTARLN